MVHKLEELFNQYTAIAIYGAGNYAKRIYALLCCLGCKDKVISFIVTEKANDNTIGDKDIVSICEFSHNKEACLIFVAVSEVYEREIKLILTEKNFTHIAYMTDYIYSLNDEDKTQLYHNISFGDYCKYIADWYVCENVEKVEEYKVVVNELIEKGKSNLKSVGNGNLISLIVGLITGRTVKIVKALRNKGYEINIIQLQRGIPYVGENELASFGIQWKKCFCIEEVLYEALQIKPLVYYIESPYGDPGIAEIMLLHKRNFGKVIFTAYDICLGTYAGLPEAFAESERYALENADGIVWRYYSQEFIQKLFGIRYKGKMIHFSDCCDEYDIVMREKENHLLKLCSIPTHVSEGLKKNDGFKYVHTSTLEEILQKIGNRKDCCYHVFYWNVTESEKQELELLEQKYFNFKFFYHIEHTKLMAILSQYDYGCCLWSGDEIPQWPESENTENLVAHTEGMFKYGMSNKYFDFLSVGIPVIATFPKVMTDELAEQGALIKMDLRNFEVDYLIKHKKKYREQVKQAREKYLIYNQIYKLIDFFQDVARGE